MDRSVVVAVPIATAYDRVLGDALEGIFDRGHLLLPAISRTETLAGEGRWGSSPGQRRRIHLADGGTMVETLREAHSPARATYAMSELTGPFAALFDGVLGEWAFEPVGASTRVTWRWRLRPRGIPGRLATPIIARMWQGYAAKALDRIASELGASNER